MSNEYSKGNDRIVSLLENVGLENRTIASRQDIEKVQDAEICWEDVDDKIYQFRINSIDFLNEAINIV